MNRTFVKSLLAGFGLLLLLLGLLVAMILLERDGANGSKASLVQNMSPSSQESERTEGSTENITPEERLQAAELNDTADQIDQEINVYWATVIGWLQQSDFAALDQEVKDLRASAPRFGNGMWKMDVFYTALGEVQTSHEPTWAEREKQLHAWLEAGGDKVAPQLALASLEHASGWQARGGGYADAVSPEAMQTFHHRLSAAQELLESIPSDRRTDPFWGRLRISVGRGLSEPLEPMKQIAAQTRALNPDYLDAELEYCYSLLPRWYGSPGQWEQHVQEITAGRDDHYAEFAVAMAPWHSHLFRESSMSWERVRPGLEQMLKQNPDSVELLSWAALLSAQAQDREVAQPWYEAIGDQYREEVFQSPESFVHYRSWAETGQW